MLAWSQLKPLRSTAIAAALVTLLLCQRHLGFAVLFEAIVVVPWIIGSVWVIVRHPQRRLLQSARIGLWASSIAIVVVVHWFIASETRANAQAIVDAITEYSTSHGSFPPDLQSIGYSEEDVQTKLGMGGYSFNQGQPYLLYASTYAPFETDYYDFAKRRWKHGS